VGNLGYAVLLFLLASLAGVIAWQAKVPGIQVLAALVSLVFGITGALVTWDWLAARLAENTAAIRDAWAVTPASKLAEAMANLEEWQIDGLRKFGVTVGGIVDLNGGEPSFVIHCPGKVDVPMDFVVEFLGMTKDNQLCPERRWSDGSKERRWAQGLTDLAVACGWASPAIGNKSATLVVPMSEVRRGVGL